MNDLRPAICVMTKAPVPGRVKTRLAATLGPEGAAALARAMLHDTVAAVEAIPWARGVLTTTDPDHPGMSDLAGGLDLWDQGPGDLGARLERTLRRGIETSGAAIAVGSDSPGLPRALIEEARERLAAGDAVLGPCDDGGYYLIGLDRCPVGLLAGLPWSSPHTLARTRERLEEHGFGVSLTGAWFDVDRPADLERLDDLLRAGEIVAPRTAGLLQEI
jgi:rSAM/selenodomain-associated transferase 1